MIIINLKSSRGEIYVANLNALKDFSGVFNLLDFGPIPWQAAEIIGCLLDTELQSHRVTELQSDKHPRVLSVRVGEIFLCLISINSPTRFARRGIILKCNCLYQSLWYSCNFKINTSFSTHNPPLSN